MRRASIVIALLLVACDGAETEKPAKQADKAPAKAEREVETKPETDDAAKPPPGVKVKGNLPVKTESELAAEGEARNECIAECVESRKVEAKGADAIEAECQQECMAKLPIEQVEVVPDGPMPQ